MYVNLLLIYYFDFKDTAIKALKYVGGRYDAALDILLKQDSNNGLRKGTGLSPSSNKLIRKPSLERELNLHRGSPALDSGAGSSRSDSPRLTDLSHPHEKLTRQYSPSSFGETPPPPPPRCTSTPPPPPHLMHPSVQQLLKRMPPAPPVPPARGASPVTSGVNSGTTTSSSGRQPMIVQNGPQAKQQLNQQMQALSIQYQSNSNTPELLPLYSIPGCPPPPPPYSVSIQNRQSPTQSQQDYRKSPSSSIYSGGNSAGSPSPITFSQNMGTSSPMARPTPLQAWSARQAKTQPPIIMQSVKSTQVQKPILQTAIAPVAPQPVCTAPSPQPPPPSYASSIQQKQSIQQNHVSGYSVSPKPPSPNTTNMPSAASNSNPTVPTTEPPSYATTMQALAVQRGIHHQLPPPPYGNQEDGPLVNSQLSHLAISKKFSINNADSRSESPQSASNEGCQNPHYACSSNNDGIPPALPPMPSSCVANKALAVNGNDQMRPNLPPYKKIRHQSPIPERKRMTKEKEDERRDSKVRNYSPQAFKFFMEQHVENVIKSYKQRMNRKMQLEMEMNKIGLSYETQCQMRRMLSQKESNYIRLKRAKMDKSMFTQIKHIGVGAFGEVTLVRKIDTKHLYAMKTLRKADVLKRNQVAHVKAERDILAEADNEWVVKLYYSFQDKDNLYFVMDYIPGGDLMSLLIKLGIFEENLARFYIAELTCAVESVHKMGFIHRDIKPDNILIDRDGHIKLTDFGLCTGFRWTHNSKYYQRSG